MQQRIRHCNVRKPLLRASGVTLVELMIGLLLSAMLMGAFIHAMGVVKNIYVRHEALCKIQENIRSIHWIVTELLTHQGGLGCNRIGRDVSVQVQQVTGYKINANETVSLRRQPRAGSDTLWVNYVKNDYSLAAFKRMDRKYWTPGQTWVVFDCRWAAWVVLGEDRAVLESFPFQSELRIAKWHSVILYIAKTNRRKGNGQPVYALYTTDLNGRTHERVEGVEQLRIAQEGEHWLGIRALLVEGETQRWQYWRWRLKREV